MYKKFAAISNITWNPFLKSALVKSQKDLNMLEISYIALNELYENRFTLSNFDVIIVYIDLFTLSDIAQNYPFYNENELNQKKDRIEQTFCDMASLLNEYSSGEIFWCSALYHYLPLNPYLIGQDTSNAYNHFVASLNKKIQSYPHIHYVDINFLVGRIGAQHFFNEKYRQAFQNPFSLLAYQEIAILLWDVIETSSRRPIKCIVVDCDNTLWGGVLSESCSLHLGGGYPGNCYTEFQEELLRLKNCGYLLTLCSKNDESEVLSLLKSHPDMRIRISDLATYRINWNLKSNNIREISQELGISIANMVFIDDSRREIDEVKSSLPEIATLLLNSNYPHTYVSCLRSYPLFKKLNITQEDQSRTLSYQNQARRRKQAQYFTNHIDYLRSLQTHIIFEESPKNLQRVIQLSQRANKFNLSDTRLTESQISKLMLQDSNIITAVYADDIFGDFGLVGFLINSIQQGICTIESFVLSCRILGRFVEHLMINYCYYLTKRFHISKLQARYKSNNQNYTLYQFLLSNGFRESHIPDLLFYEKKERLPYPNIFEKIDYGN